jgi:biopolymer transport protein ExbD
MSFQVKKPIAANALSMTPLIDVVFLLLIFFLVASQFAQENVQLPLKLPSAASALPMTIDPQVMVVNVNNEGRFFVEGEYLQDESLKSKIQQAVQDNPINQTIVIRGDRNVPYQSIVTVLDICHAAKVPSYKLTTLENDSAN